MGLEGQLIKNRYPLTISVDISDKNVSCNGFSKETHLVDKTRIVEAVVKAINYIRASNNTLKVIIVVCYGSYENDGKTILEPFINELLKSITGEGSSSLQCKVTPIIDEKRCSDRNKAKKKTANYIVEISEKPIPHRP